MAGAEGLTFEALLKGLRSSSADAPASAQQQEQQQQQQHEEGKQPGEEATRQLMQVLVALVQHGLVRRVGGSVAAHFVATEHSARYVANASRPPAAAATKPSSGQQPMEVDKEKDGGQGAAEPAAVAAAAAAAGAATDGQARGEVLLRPWLDHDGRVNEPMLRGLVARVMALVERTPGIPQDLLLLQVCSCAVRGFCQ
jgi:hypothetical protein